MNLSLLRNGESVEIPASPGAREASASDANFSRALEIFEVFAVVIIALVSIALHVRFATHAGGLWRDEANSVNLATLPSFAEALRFLDYDSFPILFFALLRGWTDLFGLQNDAALRALGLITGLGILAALFKNARTFGIRWPVLSFALLGLNPIFIRYGDSTRAYGLGIFLIVLTFGSFWRLVETRARPKPARVAVAMFLALLSVQCLYHNSVLLLAIAAGAVAVAIQKRAWRAIGIVLALGMFSAVSLLPYVPMMQRMRKWTFLIRYDADFAWLWERICVVLGAPNSFGLWLWPGLLAIGISVAAVAWARRRSVPAAVLFAMVASVVGVASYAIFLRSLHYVTQPWYYIALLAFVACALEIFFAGWMNSPRLNFAMRIGRLSVALLVLSAASLPAWKDLSTRQTNLDLVAARLRALTAPGDLVLLPLWETAIPLSRYYHGPAEVMTLPLMGDHRFHRYDLYLREMMKPDPLRSVFARLENVLHSGHRVFVVGYVPFEKTDEKIPIIPPAYQDTDGHWHGGAYRDSWQMQTGHFLRLHAVHARNVAVPVPNAAPVQEYENMELTLVEGWRETPVP